MIGRVSLEFLYLVEELHQSSQAQEVLKQLVLQEEKEVEVEHLRN